MMWYEVPPKLEREFANNFSDWLKGGPKLGGWTRTGPELVMRIPLKFSCYHFDLLPVDEILAKNTLEVARWHLSFLRDHSHYEETAYFQEYLLPRYDQHSVHRASAFLQLYENISEEGILKAVWVADMTDYSIGFRYFRFDGCHRACCAKVLGIKEIPAMIFKPLPL